MRLRPKQTRILVTHGVSFLPFVDEIVVLVDGVISEVGSYNSLRTSKGAFSEFLDTYAKEQSSQAKSDSGKFPSTGSTSPCCKRNSFHNAS